MKAEQDFSSKIDEIKSKVQKLVSLHRRGQDSNEKLSAENKELKDQVQQQHAMLKDLNDKIKTIQITGSVASSEAENHSLKLKVNELIREVDKCLSLINS